jgi:DNA-binding transcriptional MerR regulator
MEIFSAPQTLKKYLKDGVFTLKDTACPHWLILYLEKNNVLDVKTKDSWRRYSLPELLWIRVVLRLRQMNVGIKTLREIKTEFFKKVTAKEIATSQHIEELTRRALRDLGVTRTQEMQVVTEEFLKDMSMNESSLIESVLTMMIIYRWQYSFYFSMNPPDDNGLHERTDTKIWMTPYSREQLVELSSTPDYWEIFSKSGIFISLNSVLVDLLGEKSMVKEHSAQIAVMSPDEMLIWEKLRSGKYKSMTIQFDNKALPKKLELTEVLKVKRESKFMDALYRRGYYQIVAETEEGEIVYCTCTQKIILKQNQPFISASPIGLSRGEMKQLPHPNNGESSASEQTNDQP